MPTSAVPDAVDALVDIVTAAVEAVAETVRIVDGPPLELTASDWLAVGYQPDGDTSVTQQQDFASAGARRRDEDFTISCYIEPRDAVPMPSRRWWRTPCAPPTTLRPRRRYAAVCCGRTSPRGTCGSFRALTPALP